MSTLTEAEVVEQLEHQHEQYTTGATGLPVQTDQDARMALDDSPHTQVENSGIPADFASTLVTNYNGSVNAEVYAGGAIIQPVSSTFMEGQVQAAIQAGTLFTSGGPYTSDYSLPSPYSDPLFLIEAQKLTGENWF